MDSFALLLGAAVYGGIALVLVTTWRGIHPAPRPVRLQARSRRRPVR